MKLLREKKHLNTHFRLAEIYVYTVTIVDNRFSELANWLKDSYFAQDSHHLSPLASSHTRQNSLYHKL